jgi:hypothetical protein
MSGRLAKCFALTRKMGAQGGVCSLRVTGRQDSNHRRTVLRRPGVSPWRMELLQPDKFEDMRKSPITCASHS